MPKDVPDMISMFSLLRLKNDRFQGRKVVITEHAVDRWNERVGPFMGKQELTRLFNHLVAVSFYRFHEVLKDEGVWLLDNDILFAWNSFGNELQIVTFFGRKSQNPALQNIRQLRNFNHQHQDEISLCLGKNELCLQEVPYIPKTLITFSDTWFLYHMEEVSIDQDNVITITTLQANHQAIEHKQFFKSNLEQICLSKKLRNVLNLLYEERELLNSL